MPLVNRTNTSPKDSIKHYQIVVMGELSTNWADWLGGVLFESHCLSKCSEKTTLVGIVPDQAALRGLLNKLWDLNLVIVSVNLYEGEC